MDKPLSGRTALVTGGGRGIGRAIALRLARDGADVVIAYLRRRLNAEEAALEASQFGPKVVAVRANVAEPSELDRLFNEVEDLFGRLDIFVANAATGVIRPVSELDERAWEWTMNANARALLIGGRRAARMMSSGGRIIALSSLGSSRVLPGYAVVGASKASIESLVRYLAVEFGPAGISANTVAPGVIDTDALKHFPLRERMLADASSRSPIGRLVTPEDVAHVVAFLCSDEAAVINGQTIVVDGGSSLVA